MTVAAESCREAATRPRLDLVAALLAVWLVLLAVGWWSLTAYAFKTDSPRGAAPADWPADCRLPRSQGRSSLLIFLHPKCPCSHATLSVLERMMEDDRGANFSELDLSIVACAPDSSDATWTETSLVRRAARLPRARVILDVGGVEAARFAAMVSGTVMLFDSAGVRRYAGGVTAARGHEGDNAGRDALARILAGASGSTAAIPALGCRLVLREDGADSAGEITTASVCQREGACRGRIADNLSRDGNP